jgi:Flp pilus assembly protein TadB
MGAGRYRGAAILLFAGAAVLAGVGNETGHRFLTAVAFVLFAFGALCYFRWRAAIRARVFDSEDKTR